MRFVPVTVAAAGLLASGAASAESLDEMCRSLDESPVAACALEFVRSGPAPGWELKTSLVVNEGSSAQVKRVEAHFCATVNSLRIAGQVTRWNQLSTHPLGGAEVKWSCGLPAVSAAPPQ